MNINIDKFWEWLKEWSVGKILVTLPFLVIIFKDCSEYLYELSCFIALGVFVEIFDFCNNDLTDTRKKSIGKIQVGILNIFMFASLVALFIITYKIFQL